MPERPLPLSGLPPGETEHPPGQTGSDTLRGHPTVAVLGTGTMGAGMARNLARAHLPVRVWNRTPEKARAARVR